MIAIVLAIALAISLLLLTLAVSNIRHKKNAIIALRSDIDAWQASCRTLEASNRRYEALCKAANICPPLQPIPMSASSESRWKNMQDD